MKFFKDKQGRVFILLAELEPINTKTPALVQFYSPGDDTIIEATALDWNKWVEKGIMLPNEPKKQNQTGL